MCEARRFHQRLTVRQFGWRPWLQLLITRRLQTQRAENAWRARRLRRAVDCWREVVRVTRAEQEQRASHCYTATLTNRCWTHWTRLVEHSKPKKQAATDLYEVNQNELNLTKT